ncbi:MAG: TIR domain-containing protein, partial [Algicola sp.]|nr:TIR domain-containing protein [Algicola sp.]
NNGQFYADDLGLWLWNEQGYSQNDQYQFLNMMESCGVCFSYGGDYKNEGATYVVPELLPSADDTRIREALERNWDDKTSEIITVSYSVDLLHNALFNRILALVGQQAQSGAVYWQDGLLAYETQYKSWLLFERKMQDDFKGEFCFSARGNEAQQVIDHLIRRIENEQHRWSVQLIKTQRQESANRVNKQTGALTFDQTPPQHKQPEVCISYKRQDTSQQIVDQFCEQAKAQKVHVVRDIDALKMGDSIQAFMRRIGKCKRVVIILSDAYLKSGYCMYELYDIWLNSKADPQIFGNHVKAFKLDDVTIDNIVSRLEYAGFWQDKFNQINDAVNKYGANTLGTKDLEEFKRIQQFYLNVSNILAEIADTLAPQNLEQLLDYGLDGLLEHR